MTQPVYGLTADVHAHEWSAFSHTLPSGMNNRLQMLLDEIVRLCADTHAAGGTHVVIAGDVFHHRGSVNPKVLNSLNDTLLACHDKFGTMFIILAGNHDLASKNSERLSSAVTALEAAHVRVVNYPSEVPEIGAVMVPWFDNVGELQEQICEISNSVDSADYDLIIHAPIDGVIEGLPPRGLTAEWLQGLGYRRVLSGHYHHAKQFSGTQVYSIGSLSHLTWSDVGTRAGYLLVHPDRVDYRASHLPSFVDLTQLEIEDETELLHAADGNYVRMRTETHKVGDYEAAREELLKLGARAVLVQALPKANVVTTRAGATVTAGASLEVSVTDFVKGREATDFKDIADEVAQEAMSVLTAANPT